jgi:hypothetical protein
MDTDQQANSKKLEYVICAAVWYKELELIKDIPFQSTNPKNCQTGLVFSGHRHGQCIYSKCAITGLRDCESGENEQGFLTSKNRFVSREEAAQIAFDSSQIKQSKISLYSEDLY